jgi:hypothetical protein
MDSLFGKTPYGRSRRGTSLILSDSIDGDGDEEAAGHRPLDHEQDTVPTNAAASGTREGEEETRLLSERQE